jgi:hypothetical protein
LRGDYETETQASNLIDIIEEFVKRRAARRGA